MFTRRFRRASLSALLAAAVLLVASPAGAVGTADQQQTISDGAIVLSPGIAQTFTVGRSGYLDGVGLMSPGYARVFLQVYPLRADGTPDITKPMLPFNPQAVLVAGAFTQVPLPPVKVTAGQHLALAAGLVNPVYSTGDLATASGDRYAGGELFAVPGIYTFNRVPGVDLQFTTYVSKKAPRA